MSDDERQHEGECRAGCPHRPMYTAFEIEAMVRAGGSANVSLEPITTRESEARLPVEREPTPEEWDRLLRPRTLPA